VRVCACRSESRVGAFDTPVRPWCDPDLAEHSAAGRGHHVESLRTREVLCCTNLDNKKICFAGILEPSSGLEPETPSFTMTRKSLEKTTFGVALSGSPNLGDRFWAHCGVCGGRAPGRWRRLLPQTRRTSVNRYVRRSGICPNPAPDDKRLVLKADTREYVRRLHRLFRAGRGSKA